MRAIAPEPELAQACRVIFGHDGYAELDECADLLAALEIELLQSAYKRRILETHPDRAQVLGENDEVLAARCKAVTQAYEVLSSFLRTRPSRPECAGSTCPSGTADPTSAVGANRTTPRPDEAEAAAEVRDPPSSGAPRSAAKNQVDDDDDERSSTLRRRRRVYTRRRTGRRRARATAGTRRSGAGPRRCENDGANFPPVGSMPLGPLRLAEFAYHSGLISWTTLLDAVRWQKRQRPPIGQLAVDHGLLTTDQVREILQQRRQEAASQVPFAAYARRSGYLSFFEQLVVLGRQRLMQQRIGEFFVESGHFTPGEIDALVTQLHKHNLRTSSRLQRREFGL